MKSCARIQEKLVAGEALSAGEKDHLVACPECRQLAETHAWMLSEAAVCRECDLPAEAPRPAAKTARARSRSRLAWVLAFSGAAALALAVFLRPAVDTTRVAEGLGALLEEVDRVTDVSYPAGEETPGGAEWLAGNGDDPTGGQYGWL